MYLKVHQMHGKSVICCCDADLMGKKFTEGKTCLRITESYYKGSEMTLEDAKEFIEEHIKGCDSMQIIGEAIIKYLHDSDVIDKKGLKRVDGIPHLIYIKI